MRVGIIDVLGLPYDGSTLSKRGLGGSESAIISIAKELAKLGFDVKVFNDCYSEDASPGIYDNVEYLPLGKVEEFPNGFDIFIASRSVAPFCRNSQGFKSFISIPDFTKVCHNSSFRVLWMHDTFCDGDDFIEELVGLGIIHEIFTLSDWHTSYITNCNHGRRRNFEVLKNHVWQTRNGINLWLDKAVNVRDKDPFLFIYNSSATKGMVPLVTKIWPRINSILPEAKLIVVGGYYKFKQTQAPDNQEILVNQLVSEYNGKFNITFTGLIPQKTIAELCAKSSYMIYPGAYPETFGISSVEALAHNTPIICCTFGALEEVAIDIACYKIPYAIEPNSLFPDINTEAQINIFIDKVVEAYTNKYLHQQKQYACNQVKDICTWDTVALQWKQHFFSVFKKYLPLEEYRRVNKINSRVIEVFGRRFINKETMPVYKASVELPIKVIVPIYNAEKYVKECIDSIKSQDYSNYKVIIVDDNSTDNTLSIIYENINSNFTVIENPENMGAVYNQVTSINTFCQDDDIVVLIDGDDSLYPNPNIFSKINTVYTEQEAEFTYGSSWSLADNIPLISQPYPEEVRLSKTYREYKFNWNMPYTHLRTFKKKLLNNISNECFKREGKWMKAGADNALFYNLIEQAAPDKIVCIPDILYLYNDVNPINDYKVNSQEQTLNASYILNTTNKKVSITVPTMWKCKDILYEALQLYINSSLVDDIIIIDNDRINTPEWDLLNNPKIRLVKMYENIFVNPAWNLGVSLAKNELVNIVNDDIIYDINCLEKVLKSAENPNFGIIGFSPGDTLHNQPPHIHENIDLITCNSVQRPHGFGMSMFVRKSDWIDIPDDLKIYFGDDFLFDRFFKDKKDILVLTNIKFSTPFAQTTSTITNHAEILHNEGNLYVSSIKPTLIKTEINMPKSILIAIPTNKNICVETFKSIYDLEIPPGYVTHFQYFYGYQVDQIRNLIAEWAKHYDYLFSVDSDIVLPKDSLSKLLNADKDIVSGVYIQRKIEQSIPEIYLANNVGGVSNVSIDKLYEGSQPIIEIDACGFGCVLVKNEVFLKMDYPHFYYKSALDHKNTISEDVFFCRKAKQLGFRVWVDTSIKCEHIGEYTFKVLEPPKK